MFIPSLLGFPDITMGMGGGDNIPAAGFAFLTDIDGRNATDIDNHNVEGLL